MMLQTHSATQLAPASHSDSTTPLLLLLAADARSIPARHVLGLCVCWDHIGDSPRAAAAPLEGFGPCWKQHQQLLLLWRLWVSCCCSYRWGICLQRHPVVRACSPLLGQSPVGLRPLPLLLLLRCCLGGGGGGGYDCDDLPDPQQQQQPVL